MRYMYFHSNPANKRSLVVYCQHNWMNLGLLFGKRYFYNLYSRPQISVAQNSLCLQVWFLMFNVTFSNISAISWWPVLVVEEAGVPGENHRPWAKQLYDDRPIRLIQQQNVCCHIKMCVFEDHFTIYQPKGEVNLTKRVNVDTCIIVVSKA